MQKLPGEVGTVWKQEIAFEGGLKFEEEQKNRISKGTAVWTAVQTAEQTALHSSEIIVD